MNRKNTQRAAIREYLASHPLSSTREIVDALQLEFHSTSGNLTNLYTKGECVRERDEFGVFRYALKDATPTQEAPIDIEIPSNDAESGVCKETTPKKLVKVKTLDDFTPREMFEHLKKLGYKWKPDSLYHEKITVERNYVDFDKI